MSGMETVSKSDPRARDEGTARDPTHYFCVLAILLNSPLILYVLSSSADVCSFSGCCVPDRTRRGSDSTMILCGSASIPLPTRP